MDNVLIVGDLHLKQKFVLPQVEENLNLYSANRVVFLGDATNDWYATDAFEVSAMEFYADWVQKKREEGIIVDVLLGNHDYCYIRGIEVCGTIFANISSVAKILTDRLNVKVATTVGSWLCTHAGITQRWAQKYVKGYHRNSEWSSLEFEQFLNAILGEKPKNWKVLYTVGHARGGWDEPGPLWADLRELTTNNANGLNQIVGHTPVDSAFNRKNEFAGNEFEIWACDTLSVYGGNLEPIGTGEMLLAEPNTDCTDYKIRPVPFNANDEFAWRDVAWEYARKQGISGEWW